MVDFFVVLNQEKLTDNEKYEGISKHNNIDCFFNIREDVSVVDMNPTTKRPKTKHNSNECANKSFFKAKWKIPRITEKKTQIKNLQKTNNKIANIQNT